MRSKKRSRVLKLKSDKSKREANMKSYKDLEVWKLSMDLVVDVYKLTESFPGNEIYVLTSQLRRAAISIPSNIAEGSGRKHRKEFSQFLFIAKGSLLELETQLEIAVRLGYLTISAELQEKIKLIRIMITKLNASLKVL
jgi:four helix bundle protein